MSANNGASVLDGVRQVIEAADAAGLPRPGRTVLAKQLDASDYQVRRALDQLEIERELTTAGSNQGSPVPTQPADEDSEPLDSSDHVGGPPDHDRSPEQPAAPDVATAHQPAPQLPPARGARLVSWTGFAFGSVMSIAANVLHAWLPADDRPPGWSPGIAPQIGSAVWPVGLLISVEVLSRVSWRPGWLWGLARYGGAGVVAFGSGVISYGHLREVLLAWDYGTLGASVGPLVLDGLMVVCGFALLAMTDRHSDSRAGAST